MYSLWRNRKGTIVKTRAIHDDRSTNAKPRKANELAALVRSGNLDKVFAGIELVPQPTLSLIASPSSELAAAVLAELIALAKQTYAEGE